MKDALGNRIKRYENASKMQLLPRSPLFIRVDGKAFHTFTRGMERPFSQMVIDTMVCAARKTAKEMSGFKLGYVQSDEATFMLTDYDKFETQGWFDYELQKVVSISASAFTAHFNREWDRQTDLARFDNPRVYQKPPALFDSRAFTVPAEEAPNVFLWRQRDWERNSIQMLARAYFSHKECEGKNVETLKEMLLSQHRIDWNNLGDQLKFGTFIDYDGSLSHSRIDYEMLDFYLNMAVKIGDKNG